MQATPAYLAETMKTNIRELVAVGVIPADVSDFGVLHDYCDANVLGENEELFGAMVSESATDEEHQAKLDAFMEIAGPAQEIVHQWLQQGMP